MTTLRKVACLLLIAAGHPLHAGTVTGRIADGRTNVSLPGAVVILSNFELTSQRYVAVDTVTSDSAGVFAFDSVSGGAYVVAASKEGYLPNGSQQLFYVGRNQTVTQNISLTPLAGGSGAISGRVTDSSGRPLASATVVIGLIAGDRPVALDTIGVDDGGSYSAGKLAPANSYVVTAVAPGFVTASRSGIRVRDRDTVTVDFRMKADLPAVAAAGGTVTTIHLSPRISMSGHLAISVSDVRTPGSLTFYGVNGALLHKAQLNVGRNLVVLPHKSAQRTVVAVIRQKNVISSHRFSLQCH